MSSPHEAAVEEVQSAPSFDILLSEHSQHWLSLWREFDIHVETTERHSKRIPTQLLHLNSFHTMQTISEHSCDLDIGIPARGWTGEGYYGHVFWDDVFVFPFVNLRMPDAAASLLKYRYRRLPAARRIAQEYGASGACFPWQSGNSGKEQTPQFLWIPGKRHWIPDHSHMEIHVNASIAYNIWQYYQATLNLDFMQQYGAEMLFEIARFFATYATYDSGTDRFHINGIVGPDEMHTAYPGAAKPGIDDNAYTNIMAVWSICRALELFETLSAEHRWRLCQRLKLREDEFKLWDSVSRKMYVPLRDDGVICQFKGFDDLEEFPRTPDGDLDRNLLAQVLYEQDGYLNQYKVAKQADVLMLFYLLSPVELNGIFQRLGYPYRYSSIAINTSYYLPRTINDSTLSRVAHAWVLSRLDWLQSWKLLASGLSNTSAFGKELSADSWDIFYEALGSDFFDIAARGTAKSGIHMGAMGGTLDIVQRSYTGMVILGDVLWLEPRLPAALNLLSFKLHFRNHSLAFQITRDSATVSAQYSKAKPIKIGYGTQIYDLNAGDTIDIPLQKHVA